jgi:hypothetical protein
MNGQWIVVNEHMSHRAAMYQAAICDRVGQTYFLNGVKFDGYDPQLGILIDAKGEGYATFTKDGRFKSWFFGRTRLIEQAQRQTVAAQGTPIRWYVAEYAASLAIADLIAEYPIEVIHKEIVNGKTA